MRPGRSIIAWKTSATLGSITSAMTDPWLVVGGWADEQHGRSVHPTCCKPDA
jgi:hypothetical protein